MNFEALKQSLREWERIGAGGPVFEAAKQLSEADVVWWCGDEDQIGRQHPTIAGLCMGTQEVFEEHSAMEKGCGYARIVMEAGR